MSQLAERIRSRFQGVVGSGATTTTTAPAAATDTTPSTSTAASIFQRFRRIARDDGGHRFAFQPSNGMSPTGVRAVEKAFRAMEQLYRACSCEKLQLRNSPPYLLDILPDLHELLLKTLHLQPTFMSEEYAIIFVDNVAKHCKESLKLFKHDAIQREGTGTRRTLNKNSLMFSHILQELRAICPDGVFTGERYLLTKREATEFWRSSFGKRIIVSWSEFRTALDRVHPIELMQETLALKTTIDLTCNDHVSIFEFDIFTRLFYPWETLLRNWKLLAVTHPGFAFFLTYDEVKQRLVKLNKPGSYLFRLSCTRLGQWAIGYAASDGQIFQTIPQNKHLLQALIDGQRSGFYLYPNGREFQLDLEKFLQPSQVGRVQVSQEQWELYCEMGTTFELCKICDDRAKSVRLEPCGHLLCSECLKNWQNTDMSSTCPFCRESIRGSAAIVVEGFRPTKRPDAPSLNIFDSPLPVAPALPMTSPQRESGGGRLSRDVVDFDDCCQKVASDSGRSSGDRSSGVDSLTPASSAESQTPILQAPPPPLPPRSAKKPSPSPKDVRPTRRRTPPPIPTETSEPPARPPKSIALRHQYQNVSPATAASTDPAPPPPPPSLI